MQNRITNTCQSTALKKGAWRSLCVETQSGQISWNISVKSGHPNPGSPCRFVPNDILNKTNLKIIKSYIIAILYSLTAANFYISGSSWSCCFFFLNYTLKSWFAACKLSFMEWSNERKKSPCKVREKMLFRTFVRQMKARKCKIVTGQFFIKALFYRS